MIASLLATIVVSSNAVTFTASATGVPESTPLEFLFADKTTDRDYETLFLLDDSLGELADAVRRAGIVGGRPVNAKTCDFWPTGPVVTLEPALTGLVTDVQNDFPKLPIVATGGNGDTTNMPAAGFALYAQDSSLFLFDDALDKSTAYGRFHPAREYAKGDKITFRVSWDGRSAVRALTPDFPADKTLAEAVKVAEGLAKLDSRESKINGFKDGQFFYRAYLPLVKWRDRKERLTQPLEIRLTATNETFTVVDEDWSGDGVDPKLTPREISRDEALKTKIDACIVFAPADTKLERLYQLKRDFPKTIESWYFYVEP